MKKSSGFTLIELMIVVVVIGILASIAYPQYTQYLVRASRSAAQQLMLDITSREEQYLLDARTYVAVTGNADFAGSLSMTVPNEVSPHYDVEVVLVAGPPPGYTITATPKAGSRQANDGALTLNQAGAKTGKW